MEGCYSRYEYTSKVVRGDSSSGLMFIPFQDWFPDSKTMIIERPIDEVIESLKKVDLFSNPVYDMLLESQRLLNTLKGLRVDFHDLDFKQIWTYLIGDGFDKEYTEIMDKVNIQNINREPDVEALQSLVEE